VRVQQDFVRFQTDVHALKGKEIVKEVLRTLDHTKSVLEPDVQLALGLLREWDFNLDRNSVAAAIYEVLTVCD
jgi:acyl-homoserine lactone acylase PvdQ